MVRLGAIREATLPVLALRNDCGEFLVLVEKMAVGFLACPDGRLAGRLPCSEFRVKVDDGLSLGGADRVRAFLQDVALTVCLCVRHRAAEAQEVVNPLLRADAYRYRHGRLAESLRHSFRNRVRLGFPFPLPRGEGPRQCARDSRRRNHP
jgi:hypothetical protein